jgi:hypothetical protein
LKSFFLRNAWSKPGAGKRVVHALRRVRRQRADLYPRIRDIVDPIYIAL